MPAVVAWKVAPRPIKRGLLFVVIAMCGLTCLIVMQNITSGSASCNAPAAAGLELNPTPGQIPFHATAAELNNGRAIVDEAAVAAPSDPGRAATIALATSMQEHGLQTDSSSYVTARSSGSIGPFQQLPSWGPAPVRNDPAQSAGLFYAALTKLPGWSAQPLGVIAQAVQRSSDSGGGLYARYENAAAQLVAQVSSAGGVSLAGTACAATVASSGSLPTQAVGAWITSPLVDVDITQTSTAGVVVAQKAVFSTVPTGGYDVAPFPAGQCTWWAAYNRPIYPGNKMGNGGQWYQTAVDTGHAVSKVPTVGAWAVWSPSTPGSQNDGHVAIVIAVSQDGSQFEVSEMNWIGNGVVDQRTDTTSDQYLTGFIPE